jgi:hypothetical protein
MLQKLSNPGADDGVIIGQDNANWFTQSDFPACWNFASIWRAVSAKAAPRRG